MDRKQLKHQYKQNGPTLGVTSQQCASVPFKSPRMTVSCHRRSEYANSSGRQCRDRVEETLLHLFLHSQQYRGEAAALLNAAGHRVPDFDFVLWLRNGEPAGAPG